MIAPHQNIDAKGLTMTPMSIYNEDSIGKRIQWARKQKGLTGHELGRRLVTQGTVTGVRNVYVSQLENNHATPSPPMIRKIAEVLGVTVGFLLMETTYPYPGGSDAEPNYFSPEADAAARLIDDAPEGERQRMLAVLRAMVQHAEAHHEAQQVTPSPTQHNRFAQRLIASERVSQRAGA